MNICFLEGDMSRQGGTERMTVCLAKEFCQNHYVSIISLKVQGEVFFSLNEKVKHISLNEKNVIGQISKIHAFFKDEKIDWAINVDVGMSIYGIPASWGTDTKVITWEHANYYNNWGSKIFPYIRRFAARYSTVLVVLTEKDKENYERNISSKVPVYTIPNPVQKQAVSYNLESKTILSVGALVNIKGYERAIEVAKRVLPFYEDWKWIICGEGPERERLQQLIDEAGLKEKVFLPGVVRKIEEKYKNAAMVVMTSYMEGLPMALLEAKSYGLPLVSFDIMTGPSDIITDGVNGFLILDNDVELMADKIITLIKDKEQRRLFSKNSQSDIQRYDIANIVSMWEALMTS